MDTRGMQVGQTGSKETKVAQEVLDAPASRSIPIARRGIKTLADVWAAGLAVAEDAILGTISPKAASATVGGLSVSLRAKQLEMKAAESLPRAGSCNGDISLLEGCQVLTDEDLEIASLEKTLADKKSARAKVMNETPGTARGA